MLRAFVKPVYVHTWKAQPKWSSSISYYGAVRKFYQ